jgi:hypothetical protein
MALRDEVLGLAHRGTALSVGVGCAHRFISDTLRAYILKRVKSQFVEPIREVVQRSATPHGTMSTQCGPFFVSLLTITEH